MDGRFRIDRERWLALSTYLDRALGTPTAERDAWLRELESSEPQMAGEVRHLLAAEITQGFNSFLSGQAASLPRDVQHARSGQIIGTIAYYTRLVVAGPRSIIRQSRASSMAA